MGHAVWNTKSHCTHCCMPASERFMKYISGSGGWLTKWPKWTKQKEILKISPECRVKGQLPHLEGGMVGKGMGSTSLRALGGVGLTNYEKALFQGSFRPLMWHYLLTTRNPHFPLSSSHQGGTGVGENLVKGELGTQPHWAPVQGTSTPTSSPGGVTYLIKARQVTQMSYAALYKHLALLAVTISRYVYTSPTPKVTLHPYIYGSLPLVVFGPIAVTYLILPLYMCMQMV